MAFAIVIDGVGGPEVLRFGEVPVGEPGPGEVRVRQSAMGVNFIDVYHRTGLYKAPRLPFVPGMEGAGVIEAVGDGVTDARVGQRVAYTGVLGAYADQRLVPASMVVPLPADIPDEIAAACMMRGLTAEFLLRRTLPLQAGDSILFHAAAGGVGLIACQWARHLGLRLIGTAGGAEKCQRARAAGAAEVIDYLAEDFVARVKELTNGQGVKAVFDGVGKDTFDKSLNCLRPFGMMVAFGQSSGPVAPLDVLTLSAKGSLYLTRPTVMTHAADRARYLDMAAELFTVVRSGAVKIEIGQRFALRDAADAHRALEGRRTVGSTILVAGT